MNATPNIKLRVVESVKSLCSLDIGNFLDKNSNILIDINKLPSFSKFIGFKA